MARSEKPGAQRKLDGPAEHDSRVAFHSNRCSGEAGVPLPVAVIVEIH